MLQMAQDMLKGLQQRFRTTIHVMADLAESVGAPTTVTSLLHGVERFIAPNGGTDAVEDFATPPSSYKPSGGDGAGGVTTKPQTLAHHDVPGSEPAKKRAVGKKRGLVGAKDLSAQVRPLEVDDAINGSTYLARIIWSLGVAELEETAPLRPADMARMIMARSPVSLEPPNVARYIRRSKPTCIAVDHNEGGSNFYRLNEEGQSLFSEKFRLK